jgi:ABC-type transporter MlaC component
MNFAFTTTTTILTIHLILVAWLFIDFFHFAFSVTSSETQTNLYRIITESTADPFETIKKSKSYAIEFPKNVTIQSLFDQLYNVLNEEIAVQVVLVGFSHIDLVTFPKQTCI